MPENDSRARSGVQAVIMRMIQGAGLKNQSDLARELGVRRAAITDAKRRGRIPSQWTLGLCRSRGLNPIWLETGAGPERLEGGAGFPAGASHDPEEEIFMTPLVRARISGGAGSLETSAEVLGRVPFAYRTLKRLGAVESMRLMRVAGDSMSPAIEDNDLAMVDLSATEPFAGKIYAVRIDDEIVVKRLGRAPGRLTLISDNHAVYPPIEVELNGSVDVAVIGKVVWIGREMG